jgi:LuxR family maltose regulon positive regulatory protein
VRCLDEVEQQLATTAKADLGSQLAWVKAVRCAIACFQNDLPQAESLAGQAFQDLSADDHFFQAIIYGSLGDTYRRNSRWTKAKECYVRLLDFIHAPAFQLQAIHVFGALADLDLRQGHLRDAAGYWQKALTAIRERSNWGRLPLPLTGWVYIRLAELHYEWNELAEAREHLARGLERAELGDDIRAMIAGYLIGGQLKLTDGDLDSAAAYLEQARPLVEQAQFSHWISRFERFQLTLWLAQDRLRTAVIWSDQMLADQMLTERPESEGAQLAIAYVLIIKGDPLSLERALALLKALLQTAQDEDLLGIQIESLLLQALAQWHLSEQLKAMTSLERALRLAEPEGYIRRFADYGLDLARLLQEAQARKVMPGYVETLLSAFGSDMSSPIPDQQVLPEPLTKREEEILELIAAGLTNPEIAETLVISPGTVKKHAGHIYGKLGVHSRTEAAARARELDLLD